MPAIPLPDSAFSVPEFITADGKGEDLVLLYNVIVQRMREETTGVAMTTIAEMLLERVATNYVILRWRERQAPKAGGFDTSGQAKDYNLFWLSLTREFTVLTKSTVDVGESYKKAVLDSVSNAISTALYGMHPDVAGPLRSKLANAFADAGL